MTLQEIKDTARDWLVDSFKENVNDNHLRLLNLLISMADSEARRETVYECASIAQEAAKNIAAWRK